MSAAIYGVDLGTTFTKCALVEGEKVRVFDLDVDISELGQAMPTRLRGLRSVVTVANVRGQRVAYVGNRAIQSRERFKRQETPHYAFEEAKLWIGTDFSGAVGGDPPPWNFDGHNWNYRPEDVGALVLRAVSREVQRVGASPLQRMVVTHPAQFDSTQQQATRHAAALAGVEVLDLLTEPEAAAIAYSREIREDGLYLIFDLGGGTLDLVLLEIKDRQFRSVCKNGSKIGGRDFDRAILDVMIAGCTSYTNDVFTSDMLGAVGEQLWMAHAERVKRQLNDAAVPAEKVLKFDIPIDSEYALSIGAISDPLPDKFTLAVSREDIESDRSASNLISGSRDLVTNTLRDASVSWSDIRGIISVGGSSKMLAVGALLDELCSGRVLRNLDPDTVVAQGAAIYAASLSGRSAQAVVPDDLIKRTPYRGTLFRSVGIRVEAEDGSGRVVSLVKRGTATPLEKPYEKQFTTSKPNQDHIVIQLVEGESPDPDDCDNNLIGECRIDGFEPSPKPQKVTVGVQIEGNDTKRIIVTIAGKSHEKLIEFDPRKVLERRDVEVRREFLDTLSLPTE